MTDRFSTMRVLLVAKPWQGGLAHYVHQALAEMVGPQRVTLLSSRPVTLADRMLARRSKAEWYERLVQRIRAQNYDAAIFLFPLACFAALGNPQRHACWLVDDGAISPALAASMGHIFLSDPGYLADLQRTVPAGHVAGVLPFAMLPGFHAPQPGRAAARRSLCFIANRDPKRHAFLQALLARDMDCHSYGNYFPHSPLFWQYPRRFHAPVSNAAMGRVYARYEASLNIHGAVVKGGTNMRSYEAAGYGAAQLVEALPGLEALFEPEKEILTFTDVDSCMAQYARLMGDADLRARLAANARARALAEHTYQHRVRVMLERF